MIIWNKMMMMIKMNRKVMIYTIHSMKMMIILMVLVMRNTTAIMDGVMM